MDRMMSQHKSVKTPVKKKLMAHKPESRADRIIARSKSITEWNLGRKLTQPLITQKRVEYSKKKM